ncbi:MAG: hypothetical protein HYY28_14250 [Betaproteobacteria bacterium]|nr:hypothetical protein [Betaproteobacteria bacterium]MBI2961470.1 hypothetical protein [Betaproteobacteria bacterium]
MKLNHTCVIPVNRAVLWNFLMDVPRVSQCLPGVQDVKAQGANVYEGTMKMRVGPVNLNLHGRIHIEARDPEAGRATMSAEADDKKILGGIRSRMSMVLSPESTQGTVFNVETDVTILGKLGEFGQPIVRKKADAIMQEFAENVRRQLVEEGT